MKRLIAVLIIGGLASVALAAPKSPGVNYTTQVFAGKPDPWKHCVDDGVCTTLREPPPGSRLVCLPGVDCPSLERTWGECSPPPAGVGPVLCAIYRADFTSRTGLPYDVKTSDEKEGQYQTALADIWRLDPNHFPAHASFDGSPIEREVVDAWQARDAGLFCYATQLRKEPGSSADNPIVHDFYAQCPPVCTTATKCAPPPIGVVYSSRDGWGCSQFNLCRAGGPPPPPPPPAPRCGDGHKDPGETCANCPADIGACTPPPPPPCKPCVSIPAQAIDDAQKAVAGYKPGPLKKAARNALAALKAMDSYCPREPSTAVLKVVLEK